jgi:hypothetical protein
MLVAEHARERVLAVIVAELAPLIGANMARSAARMHCEKLGLTADMWDGPDVEHLLQAFAPGLHVFVGKNKTADALNQIRRALALEVP